MKHKKFLIGWILVVAVLAVASILVSSPASQETIQEAMRDAVLHETGRVSLFGMKNVNPGLISGMVVTAFLLIVAALIRIFAIPKFRYVPANSRCSWSRWSGCSTTSPRAILLTGTAFWALISSPQVSTSLWEPCLSCLAFRP